MSFHTGILPREGFHADVLGLWIKKTVLNPLLTVPALLLVKYHEKGQELAAQHLSSRALDITAFLAVWGSLRVVNNLLDKRIINNGVKDTYDWGKEVVVITGGADGIGKAIALMLTSRNIKVVVLDVQALTYEAPPSLLYIKTDVTSTDALSAASNQISKHFGKSPTVLILNAGVCRGKAILASTAADVALTYNVNAISLFSMMREFLPSLVQANHGMIVTVASSAAWVTAPAMTDYASTKAAAQTFHEGLSTELITHYNAPRVRTVLVNQGYTKTALFQGFGVKPGFFAPPLEVDTVAEEIVKQVLKGESGQIILPGFYKLIGPIWRAFPLWMQHGARAGMKDIMKEWHGRQVAGLDTATGQAKS